MRFEDTQYSPPKPTASTGDQLKAVDTEITMRYSLDREITKAEERVQALKDIKKRLEERGVIDCKLQDIRAAMREIY